FPNGYNSWFMETTETLPDGNTNTVFTNAYAEVMLKVYHDATSGNNWEWSNKYDSAGRIILSAAPSALTGYSVNYAHFLHSQTGNYQYMSDNTGLITLHDYYTTTTAGESTAGGVAGDLQDDKVQQGELGSAITVDSMQYFLHTANSISVAPV